MDTLTIMGTCHNLLLLKIFLKINKYYTLLLTQEILKLQISQFITKVNNDEKWYI